MEQDKYKYNIILEKHQQDDNNEPKLIDMLPNISKLQKNKLITQFFGKLCKVVMTHTDFEKMREFIENGIKRNIKNFELFCYPSVNLYLL